MPVDTQNGTMGQSGMEPLAQRMDAQEKETEELEKQAEDELNKLRVANQVVYEKKAAEGKRRARVSDAMLRQLDRAARDSEKDAIQKLEAQVPQPRPEEEIEQERRNRQVFDEMTDHLTEDKFVENAAKRGWVIDADAKVMRQIYREARSSGDPEMVELVKDIQKTDVTTSKARENFIDRMNRSNLPEHLMQEIGTLQVKAEDAEIQEKLQDFNADLEMKQSMVKEAFPKPEYTPQIDEAINEEPFKEHSVSVDVYRQKAENFKNVYETALENAQTEASSPEDVERFLYKDEALHKALQETILARTIGKNAEKEQLQLSASETEEHITESLPKFQEHSGKTLEHMIKTNGFGKLVELAVQHDGTELMHAMALSDRLKTVEEKNAVKTPDLTLQKTLKTEKTL